MQSFSDPRVTGPATTGLSITNRISNDTLKGALTYAEKSYGWSSDYELHHSGKEAA